FYERFALSQSDDPRVRLEAARAGIRVGDIRYRLGETEAAERTHRQALDVLDGLVAGLPGQPAYREALALTHDTLGHDYCAEGRWREAEREYKESVTIWDALARDKPGITAEYRMRLAHLHKDLGEHYSITLKRVEEAEAELRQAMEIAERLVRENA